MDKPTDESIIFSPNDTSQHTTQIVGHGYGHVVADMCAAAMKVLEDRIPAVKAMTPGESQALYRALVTAQLELYLKTIVVSATMVLSGLSTTEGAPSTPPANHNPRLN